MTEQIYQSILLNLSDFTVKLLFFKLEFKLIKMYNNYFMEMGLK